MKKILKFTTFAASAILINIWSIVGYYTAKLPDSYYLPKGDSLSISTVLDIKAELKDDAIESMSNQTLPLSRFATLKLFGVIPVKNVEVTTVDTPMLVPSGRPFGIKLLMDGVMVVGLGTVNSTKTPTCPAAEAGIEKGDILLTIDGKSISSNKDIQSVISECSGGTVKVNLVRDNKNITAELTPQYSDMDNCYQAGMWVRDSSAGIGTMTFCEPSTGSYGGLGHPICDVDTGEIVPLSSGEIVNVKINSVAKGLEGAPGELRGVFTSRNAIGSINSNNRYGVFGTLNVLPSDIKESKCIPMGLKQDIECGDATILTTIDGTEPKEYSISIDKIDYDSGESGKNMVIRITDEELLEKTGGIVQGMSGSPIIQNGKLIGAVTHVFVNDPTQGYGIFCENMYESGLK